MADRIVRISTHTTQHTYRLDHGSITHDLYCSVCDLHSAVQADCLLIGDEGVENMGPVLFCLNDHDHI